MALLALTAADGGQGPNNSNSSWCLPAGRSLIPWSLLESVALSWRSLFVEGFKDRVKLFSNQN